MIPTLEAHEAKRINIDRVRYMATTDDSPGIGFLGAGKMATALAQGLITSGFTTAQQVKASDVSSAAREAFSQASGARATADNAAVVAASPTVILAVKPQVIGSVLEGLRSVWTRDHLLISIAAGTSIAALAKLTGNQCRIIRVMPNTPCLVGAGASGYSTGPSATESDASFVSRLLRTVGIAVPVPEPLLDAVTGLSGSGPAYVFQIIEALSDGGVRMGLPRAAATQLAAQTLYGAAKMVLDTGEHPAALKDAVTSPGGTTIAGLHALEAGGLRAALMDAVQSATQRSQELGRG
ncbi:MAG: pyrroline-5-carboxylate reductase [Planctomycetaceae bacterium]